MTNLIIIHILYFEQLKATKKIIPRHAETFTNVDDQKKKKKINDTKS